VLVPQPSVAGAVLVNYLRLCALLEIIDIFPLLPALIWENQKSAGISVKSESAATIKNQIFNLKVNASKTMGSMKLFLN